MTCDDMEGRTRALAAWLDSSTHEPWAFSSAQAAADLRALLLAYQERGRALEAARGFVFDATLDDRYPDYAAGILKQIDATLKGKSHD
jgi:hypothetical protein